MRRFVPPFAVIVALATVRALAQQATYPARTVPVAGSPAVVASCKAEYPAPGVGGIGLAVLVVNRTRHDLLGFTVRYRAYDTENAPIGEKVFSYDLSQQPLAPGDSTMQGPLNIFMDLSEPQSVLGYFTCRIESATFIGKRTWSYGQSWKEPLLPAQSDLGPGATDETGTAQPPPSHLDFSVASAWNDEANGVLLVHAALVIRGGDADVTVSPSDFVLTMALANGGQKTYTGMTQPAPTYQKFNPLGNQTTTAYEVDPNADLGRLGSLTVPARGTATVTITFVVPDSVADPANNRSIAYR